MGPGDEPTGDPAAFVPREPAERVEGVRQNPDAVADGDEASADTVAADATTVAEDDEAAGESAVGVTPEWLEALMAEVANIEEAPVAVTTVLGDRVPETPESPPTTDPSNPAPTLGHPAASDYNSVVAASATIDPTDLVDAILEEEFGVYVQAAMAPPPVPAFDEPARPFEAPVEPENEPLSQWLSGSVPPPVPAFGEPARPFEAPVEPESEPLSQWLSGSVSPPAPAFDEPARSFEAPVEPESEPLSQWLSGSVPPPVPAFDEPARSFEAPVEPESEPVQQPEAEAPADLSSAEGAARPLADPRLDDEWD